MINAIKNSIISFKKIPLKTKNDLIFATDYKIQRKNEPDVFIKSDLDYGHNFFITKIADENDNLIAVNHFALDKADGIIETSAMNVLSKNYRNKGLGTIMHLDRIVDLLENDMDKIVLFSTGEAALFHSKLKFEPDLNNGEQLENVLTEISAKNCNNMPELKPIVKRAYNYINSSSYFSQKNCLIEPDFDKANKIISEYLHIVNSKNLSKNDLFQYKLNSDFNMILTHDSVMKNKEFFNKLFEKYGIDYQIN